MTNTETLNQEAPKAESRFFIVRTIRKTADNCATMLKDCNEKYVSKAAEKGKDFTEGVKEDFRLLMNSAAEKGKKVMPDEIPGVKKMEEKITASFKAIAEKMDLPTRKDIENLNDAVETLSKRVDDLNN
ncbi:hypothetical protein QUF72_13680 [Desulfobacterales bacterium HSG2]|nr:hypothetical protein [Desulfobacterales bacterium HSG2]